MKKKLNISELGSLMIEAMAMLALIAFITPILYRKTAERTTELQDINSAGELRAIIKAVDDYVSANYDAIVAGEKIEKGGCGDYNFSNFKDKTSHSETIPISHFCEFLPYGILDASGNAKKSRLFSENYKIVLKMNGNAEGDKVVTAFVVTEPNSDLSQLRASSIASMIGGNGGFVSDNSGDGKIAGNLGIWGIDNIKNDLGLQNLKKNAIVAASIEGISSQNAKIDLEGVLYRVDKSDLDLNTMSTTLYMGSGGGGTEYHDIVNINRLIVGTLSADANDKLYINSGNIKIGNGGNISVDGAGSLTLANGNITTNQGDIVAGSGNLRVSGTIDAANNGAGFLFNVATDGLTTAASYKTRNDQIVLNGSDATSLINQPLQVGTCGSPSGNQLCVKGDTRIEGNLVVTETFSAKNLNAREKLTVGDGGETPGSKALSVEYAANNSKFNFAEGLLSVEQTGAGKGKLTFSDYIKAEHNNTDKTFEVGAATFINLITAPGTFLMSNDQILIDMNGNTHLELKDGNAAMAALNYITLNDEMFKVSNTTTNTIESLVNSFKITPGNNKAASEYFDVNNNYSGGKGVVVNEMSTYMVGINANQYMRGGTFHLQEAGADNNSKDIVRIGKTAEDDGKAQIDIAGDKVIMEKATGENILKIDLTNLDTSTSASDSYPVYIRKGAIELTANFTDPTGYNPTVTTDNYVKADRFIANKQTKVGALLTDDGGEMAARNYEINPAYTSVMHDIKLTTRGGARLSDILPDFINKGIYIVDNTYPANGYNNCAENGHPITYYLSLGRAAKQNVKSCSYYDDYTSPWVGFVPAPTCPPGYAKVISIGIHTLSMAQAGVPQPTLGKDKDLIPSYNVIGPYNIAATEPAPTPLYFQKNTWLKSAVNPFNDGTTALGWDVLMGFIYPYTQYKNYFTAGNSGYSGSSYTAFEHQGDNNSNRIIWNMFPVYTQTLEGTATVYCYFNRGGGKFDNSVVDTSYDQLTTFRTPNSKAGADSNYLNSLNEEGSSLGYW